MVGIDVPFAFLAAGAIGRRGHGATRALAYAGLGVAVPGLVFLQAWPAWDVHYLFEVDTVPAWGPAAFTAAVLVAGLAGHRWGARRPRLLLAVAGLLGGLSALTWHQTLHVGTYADYVAGTAPLLPGAFLATLGGVGVLSGAGLAWCLFRPSR